MTMTEPVVRVRALSVFGAAVVTLGLLGCSYYHRALVLQAMAEDSSESVPLLFIHAAGNPVAIDGLAITRYRTEWTSVERTAREIAIGKRLGLHVSFTHGQPSYLLRLKPGTHTVTVRFLRQIFTKEETEYEAEEVTFACDAKEGHVYVLRSWKSIEDVTESLGLSP